MDQNTPREDATGSQQPANPASGEGSAWNQPEAAAPDPAQAGQAAPEPAQPAAAEHAAWSADAGYQQQADAAAYAAPEPQSATYSDPAPAAPADQQQAYDQQAYQQQQQQAYEQQQAAYQQQYAQQQQQPYDQQAYDQQQAAYQQQYAQQQQQPYDQQQQYAQQGYQQPQYQQGQPYAYGQPGQQQWPAQEQYWDDGGGGYGRSFMAVLAGFALLTWGVLIAVAGGLVIWLGSFQEAFGEYADTVALQDLLVEGDKQVTAWGGILLIIGLILVVAAFGIWAHRKWGRAFGIVLGLLGTIWGIGMLVSSIVVETPEITVEGVFAEDTRFLAFSVVVIATFLLVLLAMFVGKRHFKKKGVGN